MPREKNNSSFIDGENRTGLTIKIEWAAVITSAILCLLALYALLEAWGTYEQAAKIVIDACALSPPNGGLALWNTTYYG